MQLIFEDHINNMNNSNFEKSDEQSDNATLLSSFNFSNSNTQWIFWIYFLVLFSACCLNLIFILALLRCKKNGTLTLILQISITDFASFAVAFMEISTLSENSWTFSTNLCPCFKGSQVLVNTMSIYFLIALNFHIISQWNLQQTNNAKTSNPLTSSFNDDSNECLVSKQENRTITIDYRRQKNDVAVLIPIVLIWLVALSLSIPNYTLSSVFRDNGTGNNYFCAIIDDYFGNYLQVSLLTFKIAIPITLLFVSLVLLLNKYRNGSFQDKLNSVVVPAKHLTEIKKLVVFAIILTIFYFITSLQRHILQLLTYLNKNDLTSTSLSILSMLHYMGTIFRAVFTLFLLPNFVNLLQTKLFICCKNIQI